MNENNVKDASNEVSASEHLEGKTAVEEKFYLAVNDRLMYENKQLKSSVSNLELRVRHYRKMSRALFVIVLLMVITAGIFLLKGLNLSLGSETQSWESQFSDGQSVEQKADTVKRRDTKATNQLKKVKPAKKKTVANQEKPADRKTVVADKKHLAAVKKENDVKAETTESSKYNSDSRIRTGAYRIIGVSTTVTVQAGQTLSSISRTHLGPGMECYVEALNGGIHSVNPGQKIKIPMLKLKR